LIIGEKKDAGLKIYFKQNDQTRKDFKEDSKKTVPPAQIRAIKLCSRPRPASWTSSSWNTKESNNGYQALLAAVQLVPKDSLFYNDLLKTTC
jgi:hypothetical protein